MENELQFLEDPLELLYFISLPSNGDLAAANDD